MIFWLFILVILLMIAFSYFRFGRKKSIMIGFGATCLSFIVITLIHPESSKSQALEIFVQLLKVLNQNIATSLIDLVHCFLRPMFFLHTNLCKKLTYLSFTFYINTWRSTERSITIINLCLSFLLHLFYIPTDIVQIPFKLL